MQSYNRYVIECVRYVRNDVTLVISLLTLAISLIIIIGYAYLALKSEPKDYVGRYLLHIIANRVTNQFVIF